MMVHSSAMPVDTALRAYQQRPSVRPSSQPQKVATATRSTTDKVTLSLQAMQLSSAGNNVSEEATESGAEKMSEMRTGEE